MGIGDFCEGAASVNLPDIVVHLPKVKDLTMGGVATHVLDTVKGNAESMAQQLIEQPGRLTKLIGAMVLKEMARKALLKAVDSFVCRGVEKSEIKAPLDEEATQSESALEESESSMDSAVEEFTEAEVSSVSSAGF